MPQVWIALFFILLALTELYQSIQKIDLPFPAYLVLGTLLAVASNYQYKALFGQTRAATLPESGKTSALTSIQLPVLPISTNNNATPNETANNDRV
jgi:hypothetical protein